VGNLSFSSLFTKIGEGGDPFWLSERGSKVVVLTTIREKNLGEGDIVNNRELNAVGGGFGGCRFAGKARGKGQLSEFCEKKRKLVIVGVGWKLSSRSVKGNKRGQQWNSVKASGGTPTKKEKRKIIESG